VKAWPIHATRLTWLSVATIVAGATVAGLILFYAPNDADQGFVQRIFYLHVPMALVALAGFLAAAIMAINYPRSGDRSWDLRSYVAIHLSIIFGVGVLATGSIWAKASWGHWWVWEEPTLVSFLIVFLLYCIYQPLRFAIEEPERQARYASVFAITAGAFVPLNFVAVRLAEAYTHPRVLSTAGGQMPGEMRLTFIVALIAMALLFTTLCNLELAAKRAAIELRRLRRQLESPPGLDRRSAPAQGPAVATVPPRPSPH
jgi:heme exporter protein C